MTEPHPKFSTENGFSGYLISSYRGNDDNIMTNQTQDNHSEYQANDYNQPQELQTGSISNLPCTQTSNSISNYQNQPVNTNYTGQLAEELLVMTIEIGNGQNDEIHVYENDDPAELAQAFCLKHNLSPGVVVPLAQNIYHNIEQVLRDREVQAIRDRENQENQDVLMNEQQDKHVFDQDIENNNYLLSNNYKTEALKNSNPDLKGFFNEGGYDSSNERNQNYLSKKQLTKTLSKSKTPTKTTKKMNFKRDSTNNGTQELNIGNQSFNKSPLYSKEKSPLNKYTNRSKTPTGLSFGINHKSNQGKECKSPNTPSGDNSQSIINGDSKYNTIFNNDTSLMKAKDFEANQLTFTPKINKHSQDLVQNRLSNTRMPAHQRLHNIAMAKIQKSKNNLKENVQTSPSPLKTMNKSPSQTDINYGSLLYHKGLKKREELMKTYADKKREILEKEEKECTFKPQLNPISYEFQIKKYRDEPTEEILIKFGQEAKEKIERQRSMKTLQEIGNCPFRPEINPISDKIASEKDKMAPITDRCLRLYYNHKVRQAQHEMKNLAYDQECTFSPHVNNYLGKFADQTTFEERNRMILEKAEKHEQLKKQKEANELNNPSTGKPYFRPMTGRGPKANYRNKTNMPIGDYLYNQRLEMENLKRNLLEKEQKTIEDNMARSNEKSHFMMENIKKKRLQTIFNAIDIDKDGVISSTKIDISGLDNETLTAIAPLLCEIEKSHLTLTEEEFIGMAEKWLRTLNIQERSRILLGRRDGSAKIDESCTFRPNINKKSKHLAENHHPQGGLLLYEMHFEEKKIAEERIKQEKEKRLREELKECSFKPIIHSYTINNPIQPASNDAYATNSQTESEEEAIEKEGKMVHYGHKPKCDISKYQ